MKNTLDKLTGESKMYTRFGRPYSWNKKESKLYLDIP